MSEFGKDINVPSRKGVFIPGITVEMFRNASLEVVEDLMASGEMEDISLPSAQPERKKGKWIENSEPNQLGKNGVWYWKCSNCGHIGIDSFNFCHFCGADMRG